jgi:hypothetical protein
MSDLPILPIAFIDTDVVTNPTLHLSFDFDLITSIVLNEGTALNIQQSTPIQAMEISLAGRTSNPNISVAIDAVTRLFTLNSLYLTDTFPYIGTAPNKKCFVIEGYSLQNNNNEKVLIFLPMNPTTDPNNVFYPLENAIANETNNIQVNLNLFIPNVNINTDYYSYYNYTDKTGCLFHIVFFNNSYLGYSGVLNIPVNAGYTSPQGATASTSTLLALHHPKMTDQFQDNIYIDCVPVDLLNQQEDTYMQSNTDRSGYFKHMIVLFTYMIALALIVYSIYYFYIYMSKPKVIPN